MSKRTMNIAIAIVLLLIVMSFCIVYGSVKIPTFNFVDILSGNMKWQSISPQHATIILKIRLPRVVVSVLVGAGLSLSGLVMQSLLQNPLADGATLGITSSASLGAVVSIVFGLSFELGGLSTITLFSIMFAFMSLFIVISLAYVIDRRAHSMTVVLIGIVMGMLSSSLTSLFVLFSKDMTRNYVFWNLGSFSGSQHAHILFLSLCVIVPFRYLLSKSRELDMLAIGELHAYNLGVPIKKMTLSVFLCVAVMTGGAVSVSGAIGFVGLLVPHFMRKLFGVRHRDLIIMTVLYGGMFMALVDLFSRTIMSPIELPIGIVTSILGVGAFMVLYVRKQGCHD